MGRGTRVAQLFVCLTLGFGSGHNLLGSWDWTPWGSLLMTLSPLPLFPECTWVLSQINILKNGFSPCDENFIYYHDYCCFLVSFEIRKCESSYLVVLQHCFCYSVWILHQHVNFCKEVSLNSDVKFHWRCISSWGLFPS